MSIDKIRVHNCGGGYTDYAMSGERINIPFATDSGIAKGIVAGNYCGLTFYWGSEIDINGSGFTVEYSEATTAVALNTVIDPVYLSPYTVISGSMSGLGPWLHVTIN